MKKKQFIASLVLGCLAFFAVVTALLVVVRAYSHDSLYLDKDYIAAAEAEKEAAAKETKKETDTGSSSDVPSKTEKNEDKSTSTDIALHQDDIPSADEVGVSENSVVKVPEKSYRIEDGNVPVPDPDKFIKVSNAQAGEVLKLMEEARDSGLFSEDEKFIFSPDVEFVSWSDIRYYYDESIFAVLWKEMKDGRYMTYGEIKIKDPSQFRRKLADDTYGSPTQYFCTQLNEQVNSVVTMNADFYAFRNLGITVYEGEIHRFDTSLDVLFIDRNGDFIYYDRDTETTREDIEKFVEENGVEFSLAFGPAMVKDHELLDISGYPIGQNETRYSRTCLCQVDELHYLFANIGYFSKQNTGGTSSELAKWVWEKGVKEAYMMDGGQTSEILFNGEIFNLLSYGNERTVSDIIYFATAVDREKDG